MNHTRFLAIFLPVALILPLAGLFLPTAIGGGYLEVVQIALLILSSGLSFAVAMSYRKELKSVFLFLALYLIILGLAIIFLPLLENPLGAAFTDFVLGWQIVDYLMLVIACVYILKVVSVKKLNAAGWGVSGAMLVISAFTALYPALAELPDATSLENVLGITIRLVDAALITALTPVIWLYLQHLKTQQQQSLTFTVIIAGIIFSTIGDYLYQTLITALGAEGGGVIGLIPNMIYVYGYAIIAVGMYAHWKQDEWGYKMLDKALAI